MSAVCWPKALGGQTPQTVFSHVDTLDVDNEDFLTVSQSHCWLYDRIISYALCVDSFSKE